MSISRLFSSSKPSLTTPNAAQNTSANPVGNAMMAQNAVNNSILGGYGGGGMGMGGAVPHVPYYGASLASQISRDKHWNIEVIKTENGFRLAVMHKGEHKEYIAKDTKELTDMILSAMVLSKITAKSEGAEAYAQASNGGY